MLFVVKALLALMQLWKKKLLPKNIIVVKKKSQFNNSFNAIRYFRTNSHKFIIQTYEIILIIITIIMVKCYIKRVKYNKL